MNIYHPRPLRNDFSTSEVATCVLVIIAPICFYMALGMTFFPDELYFVFGFIPFSALTFQLLISYYDRRFKQRQLEWIKWANNLYPIELSTLYWLYDNTPIDSFEYFQTDYHKQVGWDESENYYVSFTDHSEELVFNLAFPQYRKQVYALDFGLIYSAKESAAV